MAGEGSAGAGAGAGELRTASEPAIAPEIVLQLSGSRPESARRRPPERRSRALCRSFAGCYRQSMGRRRGARSAAALSPPHVQSSRLQEVAQEARQPHRVPIKLMVLSPV